MTTAPAFLFRCHDCLGLHPWRQAPRDAPPIERVELHICPHGLPCGPKVCEHGRLFSRVYAEPDGDGPTKLACPCIPPAGCQACADERVRVRAERIQKARENPRGAAAMRLRVMGTCATCREVERQAGKQSEIVTTWCICVTTRKDGKDTLFVPPLFGCPHKSGERPPPWCAGATDAERKAFLEALPEPLRADALEEARKANRQDGAAQRREVPKREKRREDRQTKLF